MTLSEVVAEAKRRNLKVVLKYQDLPNGHRDPMPMPTIDPYSKPMTSLTFQLSHATKKVFRITFYDHYLDPWKMEAAAVAKWGAVTGRNNELSQIFWGDLQHTYAALDSGSRELIVSDEDQVPSDTAAAKSLLGPPDIPKL